MDLLIALAAAGSFLAAKTFTKSKQGILDAEALKQAEEKKSYIIDEAKRDADRIIKDAELRAKEDAFKKREELTKDVEKVRNELRETERKLDKRETALEDRSNDLGMKERTVDTQLKKMTERKDVLDRKTKELESLMQEETKRLHDITGLSRENAEKLLMDRLEREMANEVATKIHKANETIKASAETKAREMIATAIQRCAANHCADTTTSTVDIPSEEVKGRIIGREGRNIRTFEKCTGVDVIVDDTPGIVIVSAFDNVRGRSHGFRWRS